MRRRDLLDYSTGRVFRRLCISFDWFYISCSKTTNPTKWKLHVTCHCRDPIESAFTTLGI